MPLVQAMLAWLRTGPPEASVSTVDVTDADVTDADRHRVRQEFRIER